MSTADKVVCYGLVIVFFAYVVYRLLRFAIEYMSPDSRRRRAISREIRRDLEARLTSLTSSVATVGGGETATDDSPAAPSDNGDPDLGNGRGPGYGGCCGM